MNESIILKNLKNNETDNKRKTELEKASEIIKNGGLVIFPTETVYAIGANGLDSNAVEIIYKVKERDLNNPINLLVSSKEMIYNITEEVTKIERKIIEKFFPGAITIILKKKKSIPDIVTAGNDTVGIRMPNNKIAIDLIKLAGVPIAAPSANLSGKPSGTNIDVIKDDFYGKVDLIIDGGESKIGIESTIVKVIDETIHILRPGSVTEDDLKSITPNVELDYKNENNELPSSNIKHYCIKTKAILIYNEDNTKIVKEIQQEIEKYNNPIVLCCNENRIYYKTKNVIEIGEKNNFKEISKNIFKKLQEADKLNGDIIIIEGVEEKDLGIAVMDRLKKICEF